MTESRHVQVEPVRVEDVGIGDTIWAQGDSDWFCVASMDADSWGGTVFYRANGSLAEFDEGATILRRAC